MLVLFDYWVGASNRIVRQCEYNNLYYSIIHIITIMMLYFISFSQSTRA